MPPQTVHCLGGSCCLGYQIFISYFPKTCLNTVEFLKHWFLLNCNLITSWALIMIKAIHVCSLELMYYFIFFRMMAMHSGLMKRYEKELKLNVQQMETINELSVRKLSCRCCILSFGLSLISQYFTPMEFVPPNSLNPSCDLETVSVSECVWTNSEDQFFFFFFTYLELM